MTVSQAYRLAWLTRRLGYKAEPVVAGWGPRRGSAATNACLRLRRGTELWWWLWSHREWPTTIRVFRALDRSDGITRP